MDQSTRAFQAAAPLPDVRYYRLFGKGGQLPFASGTFDLVLCHHSLEHIAGPEEALREITRVLKPDGRLYIAVPNGYGLCDAVYRYVFAGGGHVNRFSRRELVATVQSAVGVHLARWHKLYSSFVYLDRLRRQAATRDPRLSPRLRRLGRFPRLIAVVQWLLYLGTRAADRIFHTDLAVYGWALYFERAPRTPLEDPAYVNVCLSCGAGQDRELVSRPSWFRYVCAVCGRTNPFVRPFRNTR